jgi:hypothetical protein
LTKVAVPRLVVKENYGPVEPYNYGYQTTDNSVTRQEVSDGNGAVRGSYSYTNIQVYHLLIILMKVKAICSFKIFESLFM